jgi:hypothetical protein
MIRLLKILFVCSAIMLPAGCADTQKQKKPDIKGIKIGDLAPTGKRIQPKILHTTNIEVISYELPAENIAWIPVHCDTTTPIVSQQTDCEPLWVNSPHLIK